MKLTLLFREAFEWMLTTTMNPTLKATPATKTKSRNWLINLSNVKQKKQRKELDIESIKKELLSRNYFDRLVENTPQRKMSTRKSRMATNQHESSIVSSQSLIEKLMTIKFFARVSEELSREVMNQIFNELRYEFVPQFNTVYHQGELSKRFYIILEGTVVILKTKDKLVAHNFLKDPEEPMEVGTLDDIDPVTYILSHNTGYQHIKTLNSGQSFGEIALKLDIARSSTVIAALDTHLLWISEKAYKTLLNPFFSSMFDQKLSFLKQNSLFADIETEHIMGILLEIHYQSFTAGQIIFDEGQKAKDIYFIFRGEVELSRKLPEYILNEKKNEVISDHVILAAYGQGQMFGEVEIVMKTNRSSRARVITPKLELYKIHKNKFFENLGSFKVLDQMKKTSQAIIDFHQEFYDKQIEYILQEKDEVMIQIAQQRNGQVQKCSKIINERVIQHHKENLIKMFQAMADKDLVAPKAQNQPHTLTFQNRDVLQKVYSNSIQNYLDKIVVHKSQKSSDFTLSIRKSESKKELIVRKQSVIEKINQSRLSSPNLSRISPSQSFNLPQINFRNEEKKSIKPVVSSISSLPKIPRDNLVLTIMKLNARKSKHPGRAQRKIEMMYELAAEKALHRFKSHPRIKSNLSPQERNLKLLKILNIGDIMKKKQMETPIPPGILMKSLK